MCRPRRLSCRRAHTDGRVLWRSAEPAPWPDRRSGQPLWPSDSQARRPWQTQSTEMRGPATRGLPGVPIAARFGRRPARRGRSRSPRRRSSSLTCDLSGGTAPTLTLPRKRGREIFAGLRDLTELAVDVEQFHVEPGGDLHIAQLAAPEDVANAAPSCLEEVGHRPRRARTIDVPIGDQPRCESIGADCRLARAHPGAGAAADIFKVTDGRVLETGCRVLRPQPGAGAE